MLVNPAARAGAHGRAVPEAAEHLRARGIRTTVLSGGSAAESTRLLRTALSLGTEAVVVAGGDGTVHLAIQELAGTPVPLGIIPIGTGNDMAAAVGLGDLDIAGAVELIARGRTRRIDLARISRADGPGEFFGTVLASGFDSRVNDRANAMRRPRGRSRYTIAILREFLTLRGIPYTLDLVRADGTQERLSGDLLMATVGNGRTYGGRIPICPDADIADGMLDLTLVRPVGRLRLLRLLPRVYRGTHTGVAEVSTHRVTRVRMDAAGVTAYADGEPVGALPLEIEVVPAALSLFAPDG